MQRDHVEGVFHSIFFKGKRGTITASRLRNIQGRMPEDLLVVFSQVKERLTNVSSYENNN